ncbi:RdgB/HAM1 family non-canonical purine NTP pyrophosphatase [Legionella sp. W05-934-2]|jgi:XTP/dITP diphosphohydrolase|uniref:RdgB/HAM1 family non-canonical purine NTP pyrophosphatase n=1 Tax=Legionella sp. W05-934-2 TaxID=1198649 RepID=UPI0034627F23
MSETIFIATANRGKIAEFQQMLTDKTIVSFVDTNFPSPEETGLTFIENALIKARFASEQTKLPALADDSGLVVPALQGEPGIYSARYAGEDGNHAANMAKLLEKMDNFPPEKRQAYFVCVLVYLQHAHDPMPLIAVGEMQGRIHHHPQGQGGFGYDPIFFLPEYQCTAAEIAPKLKNAISHRGKALAILREKLYGG